MEGPSLVIACEELAPWFGHRVDAVDGAQAKTFGSLRGHEFTEAKSWGKHLLLRFEDVTLRIHFLMFGSYRINDPRENRIPKLELRFGRGTIYFYSCAIRALDRKIEDIYDWTTDLMSPAWDSKKALDAVREIPKTMVCDALMDQTIFAGSGNIIKNEVLFNLELHPEARVGALSAAQQQALVKEVHTYSHQFYEWKKVGQLKRNWRIFRKKVCPRCHVPVKKRPTGKLERFSHYCTSCQLKPKTKATPKITTGRKHPSSIGDSSSRRLRH